MRSRTVIFERKGRSPYRVCVRAPTLGEAVQRAFLFFGNLGREVVFSKAKNMTITVRPCNCPGANKGKPKSEKPERRE